MLNSCESFWSFRPILATYPCLPSFLCDWDELCFTTKSVSFDFDGNYFYTTQNAYTFCMNATATNEKRLWDANGYTFAWWKIIPKRQYSKNLEHIKTLNKHWFVIILHFRTTARHQHPMYISYLNPPSRPLLVTWDSASERGRTLRGSPSPLRPFSKILTPY